MHSPKILKFFCLLVDLTAGESIPEWILTALMNPNVIKHAYNAAFEWYCLNTAGYRTPLEQWNCTMIHGLYCGYTAGLDATGKAIGLPQDKKGFDPIFLYSLQADKE